MHLYVGVTMHVEARGLLEDLLGCHRLWFFETGLTTSQEPTK